MIQVTKPYLPPLSDYQSYLQEIWQRSWLTNNGPLAEVLEKKLTHHLGVPDIVLVSSGTIALQLAIKVLQLKGEVITTPFSYVATTSSLVWEGCTPVFADINPATFNIDPATIEPLITKNTTAIAATHVFGNPCETDALQAIADRHGLKIIYDAAHCFGTVYKGKSLFACGDISTTSFHATKLFHTIEGGAVFANDVAFLQKAKMLRNFGLNDKGDFEAAGINAKCSEFHAAMGLAVLPNIQSITGRYKELSSYYTKTLNETGLVYQQIATDTAYNYSFYPVLFQSEDLLNECAVALNRNNISPKRYFYPSLNRLNYVLAQTCAISEDISKRILCLPLYYDLGVNEIDQIAAVVKKSLCKKPLAMKTS